MMCLMATAEETVDRITEALQQKIGDRELRCPLCQHEQWQIPPSFLPLTLKKSPRSVQLGGTVLPTVPLTLRLSLDLATPGPRQARAVGQSVSGHPPAS